MRAANTTTGGPSPESLRLLDAHPHPAWIVEGPARRIIAVNVAAVDVYGVDRSTFLTLFLGAEGPTAWPEPPKAAEGLHVCRHRDRHGARIWVRVADIPLGDEPDDLRRLVWARDITDGRLADDRLGLLEAAVDATQEIIIVTSSWCGGDDASPVVVYANSALERATGWPVTALLGRTLRQLVHSDSDPQALEGIAEALANNTAISLEVLIRHRSGAGRWMHIAFRPHQSCSGEAGFHVWALQDVTVRRMLQEQLLHATGVHAVGRLASSLTHDFNNLLMIVAESASLALQHSHRDDALTKYLEEIQSAAESAKGLTGQLLAISRVGDPEPGLLDPCETVRRVAPLLRRLAGEGVRLQVELPDPCVGVRIRADPSHLEQMLLNLVANARDALPDGGDVTVRVAGDGEEVHILVLDTGRGMDAETMERATDTFFTTKPRGEGTGLGLAAVRTMTEQYGGRLELRSAVGQGTLVTIALPRAEPEPLAAAVPFAPPAPIVSAPADPVLVVEDEPSLRALLVLALGEDGFRVRESDGHEGADTIVSEGPYSLVVTDLNLGTRGSARPLLQALRRGQPDVPVLCISGYVHDPLDELTPPPTFLAKPFGLTEFSTAVGQALTQVGAP